MLPVIAAEEREIGVENTFYYNYSKQRWEQRGPSVLLPLLPLLLLLLLQLLLLFQVMHRCIYISI